MELVAILVYMKTHIIILLLSIVVIYLLGLLIYVNSNDVFGVAKFKKEFKLMFKPIKKKQRKNIEIKSEETSKVIEQINKLHIMYEKINISLANAQNLSLKEKNIHMAKLKITYDKFLKFEKYILTYHEQINTYYNIDSVPVRVADKLKEFEDIWK